MLEDLRILLTRTHYDQLVVCAADTGVYEGYPITIGSTGWQSRFDGGQDISVPGDFVVLYGEASEMRELEGQPSFLYAMVVRGDSKFSEDKVVLLRHRLFATALEYRDLQNGGLDLIQSAYVRPGIYWKNEPDSDWDCWLSEEEVPAQVLATMNKAVETVRGLFGQGGDFFKIK